MILARAGGGQSFGGFGGGGGGFGGGGGISGGGRGFGFPIFFGGGFGGGGSILVLLVIVGLIVLVGAAAVRRRGQPLEPPMEDEGLSGRPAWPAPGASREGHAADESDAAGDGASAAGLSAIERHDPAFNETAFIASAERAFFLVQKAWSEQKPELSRQVMADGVWQQHKSQMEAQQAAGTRNLLDGLAVGSADVVAATSDQTYDTVTVRFLAASADYDVNPSGKVVRGDRQIRQWTEDWIFQRSSSATTRSGGGTLDSKCPNCGAPLDLDLGGVCQYCHAPVMSGRYDWVLSRIEQVRGTYGLGA